MESRFKDDAGWATLASLLPAEIDTWARETGALTRMRRVGDGETLLRLALVHACGLSLRDTASWAREQGVAQLSDVALLKRLRKLPELMNRLVQSLLPDPHTGSRMFIVDGSFVCRPTAKGTDFRLHLGWEPGGMRVVQVRLTGPKPGESLQSLPWVSGSVLVGDRAYASRAGISKARAAGIDVLVRLNLTALPLQMPDGSRIDLLAVSRGLKVGEVLELDVATVPVQKPEVPSVPGRLIVIRKEPALAARERARAQREARKKKRKLKDTTGESAEYMFLFTTLKREEAGTATLLAAYRHRWQIEMLFKRTKSISGLDEVHARDPDLAAVVVLARLAGILLVQKIQEAFSPWGYGMPRKAQSMASL